MKVSGTYSFPEKRERVWNFLNDPQRLSRCIPGVEKLEVMGENHFAGEVNVGLASVKGHYKGTVKLEDVRPPEHYRMVIDGKGKQGFIKGTGTLDLEDQGASTLLRYAGDAQIGGPLAGVGQRMMEGAAKTMTAQFFTAMEAELKASPGEVARQGIFLNLWRMILKAIREKFFGGKPATET